MKWHEDHYEDDEGRQWAFSCPWAPDMEGIPEYLIMSPERRRKAWLTVTVTRHMGGGRYEDEKLWFQRNREARELREKEAKRRNAAALAGLLERHKGERYDRKLKRWVEK